MAKPIPHALAYERRPENRDWPRIASRSLYGAGLIVWLLVIAGVFYFAITHTEDVDTPNSIPVWFAALYALIGGGISGGIVASPIFGLGLIVHRFGGQLGQRCRAVTIWLHSLLIRHNCL